MQQFLISKNSQDLIVFFSGWGCDENQFTNLQDNEDVLILYDYQDLSLEFDFSKYRHIDLIAYSAGVFVASVLQKQIPNLSKKVALCGNPYLLDEKLGLSAQTIEIFKSIDLDNYLEFRRQYMVETEAEYQSYNDLQSLRSLESCQSELEALQKLYQQYKNQIDPDFDLALMAEKDVLFRLSAQKDFYQEKLRIIPKARHHIFFKFKSFREILEFDKQNEHKQ